MNRISAQSLLFAAALTASSLNAWTPAKEAVVHKRPVSKSMWIWAADKPIQNGSIACFRIEFTLDSPAAAAFVKVNYDDSGNLWLNGKSLNGGKGLNTGSRLYDLSKLLKPGRNVIAMEVKNGRGIAGVLLFGEIKMKNGKTLFLHTTADTRSVSGPLAGEWFAPQFDDSKWGKSLVHGDIISPPWSKYRDLTGDFFTPEESRTYKAAAEKSRVLPAKLAAEKFQPASIIYKDGMPWFKFGKELQWPIFDLTGGGGIYGDSWVFRHGQLGMRVFQTGQTEETFLLRDGSLTFERTDKSVRRILNLVPDAKILLYFRIAYMRDFCKKYPDETMKFGTGPADGGGELRGRPLRPSPASLKLRQEVARYLKALAEFVNKQPWAKRVVGIRVCYGIYSEWHSYGMYHAPDLSKPMTAAFRAWLKKKYKTDDALRKAWRDGKVTIETAEVPTVQERWDGKGFFRSPAADAKELDFYACYADTHADLLLFMAKTAKELFPGRLCGAYYGYALCNHPPEGSTVLLDKVLSSPYIDFLSSPPPYTPVARLAGGDYLSRGIPATFARYGKLLVIEDDSRFHHIPGFTEKAISMRSPLESRMTMRRNMLNMLFERCGTQFCDPNGGKGQRPGAFDDPAVDQGLAESLVAMKKALPVAEDSGNEIAVVWNYMERLRHYGSPKSKILQGHFVNSLTLPQLHRSGFTFDLLSMNDFALTKKKYKVVIFLNTFTLSAKEREAIKAKVRTPGTTAVFFSGAGYVTPEGFSTAAISDLTGITIAMDRKGKDSSLKFAKSGLSGTHNRGTEERFYVDDPAAESFGAYVADKKVGAALKKLPGGAVSIYAGNYPRTGAQWRELLLKTGVKPLASPGSYVRRRGNLVMFHTGTKGKHVIAFPGKVKGATELFTGTKSTGNTVIVTSEEGPGTWLFKTF